MATETNNSRLVKYLTGTTEQYNSLKENGNLNEWAYYYLIDTNETGQKTYSLYLGETLLSTGDDSSAIAALAERITALENNGGGGSSEVGGHNFYEGETLPTEGLGTVYKENDVFIVIQNVPDNATQKYRTAYYLGKNSENALVWKAMAGNYNAENIYFDKNIPITMTVGYVSGSELPFAGKNLEQAFEQTFRKEDNDTIKVEVSPSCKVSHSNAVTYLEIGQTYIPSDTSISLSLNEGSYTHGYGYVNNKDETVEDGTQATTIINNATGVESKETNPFTFTWNGNSVSPTATNGNTFTIGSVTKNTAPATAGYTAKAYYQNPGNPVSNYGKIYPSKKLDKTETSNATGTLAYWYYPMYKGFTYNPTEGEALAAKYAVVEDPENITAERVQQFEAVINAEAYNKVKTKSATASRAWRQYFYAFPQGYNWTMSSVKDSTNATCPLSKTTVTLTFNGINVIYDVYYIHNTAPYATTAISWTL